MNPIIFLVISFFTVPSFLVANSVISSYEIADLELVETAGGKPGVVTALDKTLTLSGKKKLAELITQPMVEIKKIQARQKLLQTLGNHEVRKLLREKLTIIAQNEQKFRSCFEEGFVEQTHTALKKNYFSSDLFKKYNGSSAALDMNNFGQMMLIFTPLFEHFIFHSAASNLLGTGCKHSHHNHDDHHHDHACDHHDHDCSQHGSPHFSWKDVLRETVIAGHFLFSFVSFGKMASDYWNRLEVINRVHQAMVSGYACMRAAADIINIFDKDLIEEAGLSLSFDQDAATSFMTSLAFNQFDVKHNNNLKLWSPVGPTLATYHHVLEQRQNIEELFQEVGVLDALVGVAQVMQDNAHVYNFVTLTDGHTPYVQFQNFIHPQLLAMGQMGTKNSIMLDESTQSKLVITGPNKAGKSSVTKAIAVNCVLAQTFGIIAASSGEMTPLHRLVTYINIHDNLAEDTSMFLAEMKRCDAVLGDLKTTSGKVPALCLFDDSLFRSTQSEEGEALAYRFIKKIADLPSIIMLVVTHYESLTRLEKETKGNVLNYRIALESGSSGAVIHSSYRLERGISPRELIFSIVNHSEAASILA